MGSRRDFARTAGTGLGAMIGVAAGLQRPTPHTPLDPQSWINVLDHGARGDAETDDTAAIQAVFDAHPRGVVYFPTGAYLVSGTIRVRGRLSIVGDSPRATTFRSLIPDASPVFEIWRGEGQSNKLRGLRIADFTIRGVGPGQSASGGIRLQRVYDSWVQNVRLERLAWALEGRRAIANQFDNLVIRGIRRGAGGSGEGVYLYDQSNACLFNKLRASDNEGTVVRLGYGQNLTLVSPTIETTRSTPVVVGRQQDGTYVKCRGVTILNPYFEKNRPYDMEFLRGTPPTLIQGYWGPNHKDYVAPIRYRMPVTAIGCDFPDAPGGAVRIERDDARMLFIGCTFGGEVATFRRSRFRRTAALRLVGAEGDATIGGG